MNPAIPVIANVGSQLDRAIRAYLMSLNIHAIAPIFAANNQYKKTYPCIIVHSIRSQSDPWQNYYDVQIRGEMTVAVEGQPENAAAQAQAAEANRVILDNAIGACIWALCQSVNPPTLDTSAAGITAAGQALAIGGTPQQNANNADMAQFTCQYWWYIGDTRAEPDQGGASWVEVRNFKAQVAPVVITL